MFSTSEHLSRATWSLCEAQLSALTSFFHAATEAGVRAAEVQSDTVRTALASNTVVTRQWLGSDDALPWGPAVPTDHITNPAISGQHEEH
jgi:hypothetical protein